MQDITEGSHVIDRETGDDGIVKGIFGEVARIRFTGNDFDTPVPVRDLSLITARTQVIE